MNEPGGGAKAPPLCFVGTRCPGTEAGSSRVAIRHQTACARDSPLRLSRANGRHDHWSRTAIHAPPSRRDARGLGGSASAKHAPASASPGGDLRHSVHGCTDGTGAHATERTSRLTANHPALHTLARYHHATAGCRHCQTKARGRRVHVIRSTDARLQADVHPPGRHVPRSLARQAGRSLGGERRTRPTA